MRRGLAIGLLLVVVSALLVGPPSVLFYRQLVGITGASTSSSYVSDLPQHLTFLMAGASGMGWPPHFLFHATVYAFALGSLQAGRVITATLLVLGLALLARFLFTFAAVARASARPWLSCAMAVALFFAVPLPNWWRPTEIYIGQFSSTVWHNPTTIFVTPLAFGLFYSAQHIMEAGFRWPVVASLLMVANVAAKPNYFMVFLPVIAAYLLYRGHKAGRLAGAVVRLVLVSAPAMGLMAWQYSTTFASGSDSGIGIAPFAVWMQYSPHPWASLLVSIAFPLAFLAIYRREALTDTSVRLAWWTFIVATVMFVTLSETGPRQWDGNFFWGAHISLAVLFLATAARFAAVARWDWRAYGVSLILAAHATVGVWYLARLLGGALFY